MEHHHRHKVGSRQGIWETIEDVWARVQAAMATARTWWSQRRGRAIAPVTDLPVDDAAAVEVLEVERQAIVEAIEVQRQAVEDSQQRVLVDEVRVADLERAIAQESARAQGDEGDQIAAAKASLAAAEQELCVAVENRIACAAPLEVAEATSDLGRPKNNRAVKRSGKDEQAGFTDQAKRTRKRSRTNAVLLEDEASAPVPWLAEQAIAGERMAPRGSFVVPLHPHAPHARVVGALGRLAGIDYESPAAVGQVTAVLMAQAVPAKARGGRWHHVGHGVLSKPNDGKGAVQAWRPDEAMRAARHYLVGIGADPDRHDVLVVLHQQVVQKGDRRKVEEAVHVLWSRRRDDGLIHDCEHQFVADAVGRARWDEAAGIDVGRLGAPEGKSKPVRDGFDALRKRRLCARYRSVDGKDQADCVIPLQGPEHRARLALEGAPDPGSIAGTWTSKPCYRTAVEVRRIAHHLLWGD